MFDAIKQEGARLRDGTAGRRFEEYFDGRRASGHARQPWLIAPAVLIILLGIVMLPAPGPGTVVIAVGLALLARESRTVARGLDAAERRIRPWIARLRRHHH